MSPSSGAPTLPAATTPTCTYCYAPIPDVDTPAITKMVQDHGLPVGLCLRCTLDELQLLDPPLDCPDGSLPMSRAASASHGYTLEDDLPAAFDEEGLLDVPTFETLMEWMVEGDCEALDGCLVEPDGRCPHGSPSWLLHLGLL